MALLTPPFPPPGHYVEYVRESSRALTQAEAVTVSVRTSVMVSNFCHCVLLGTIVLARSFVHAAAPVAKLNSRVF
jgi:hypothetical protein